MGKMYVALFMCMGAVLLFHYTGLIEVGEGSTLISYLLHPENLENFSLTEILKDNAIGLIGAAVGITLALVSRDMSFLLGAATFTAFWAIFKDFLAVYNKVVSINPDFTIFGILLLAVPIVSFILIILDWIRGKE